LANSLPHIPFDVAITTKELLKKSYERLTPAQKTIIRAYYGLPLDNEGKELWALLHGHALFDELGYPLEIFPDRIKYEPKEYNRLWALLGRRSGKTDALGSLIFAYEATCGGHLNFVRTGQTVVCVLISQKKEVAVQNLPFVKLTLEESPLLKKEVAFIGADEIRLKNGITIIASSPTMSGLRGLAMPVVGMDEAAFWYKDLDSANPDFEVERAVTAAQGQFPRYKQFGITSVYSKEGLAYKYHRAGTEGWKRPIGDDRTDVRGMLVVEAPTGAMWHGVDSPRITRSFLEEQRARDPEGFNREYLSLFSDSISGAFPRQLLEKAIDRKVYERPPVTNPDGTFKWHYIAAIDPGFRKDAFPLVICHYEPGVGVVVDLLRHNSPKLGTTLNPSHVLSEYQPLLTAYGIKLLYSDQGQLEALQALALHHGITIQGMDWTVASKPKIFSNLQQLLNQGRIRMLDPALGGPPNIAFEEFCSLEKVLRPNGGIGYSAPSGKHDDMAMVIAMAAKFSVGLAPQQARDQNEHIEKPKTPFELGMATIRRKQTATAGGNWDEY
jgi:hypothetical protein